MKKESLLLFFVFVLNAKILSQTYPSLNINLLANVAPETSNNWYGNNTRYASCYGWYDPVKNREYAILGSTKANFFIDVTNPSAPVICDTVRGASQNSLWREIKTYQNFAYLISDDGGSKLQIVDMSYLPDSVHLVYQSNSLVGLSHTLFVDGNKLYFGSPKNANGIQSSMSVYDISNPVSPVLLRKLAQDYPSIGHVHDMFVKNDTVYASCGYDGLHVYKFTGSNFIEIQSYTNYILGGYNHSSYLTADSKTLVFADEVPTGLPIKILDVSNFSNFTLLDTLYSHPLATPHNPYILGDRLILSYYQDGVYVYDISNPSVPLLTGYFDTNPLHGDNDNYSSSFDYQGCWAAYQGLPSGTLLASDMQNGLFILNANQALGLTEQKSNVEFSIFPNPATDSFEVLFSGNAEKYMIEIYDYKGDKVHHQEYDANVGLNKLKVDSRNLNNGFYLVCLTSTHNRMVKKMVIQH